MMQFVNNLTEIMPNGLLMLKFRITILALLCSIISYAQIDSASHFTYKLSYVSSIIYPGLSSGGEIPLLHKNKELLKKTNPRYFKERFVSGNINWYHHPGFHDNLYITAEWVLRRTRYRGFISEFSLGPGFSTTFLGGTTYRVNDTGDVSVVRLAGYNYALITIGGGAGYDFSMHKNLPFSSFAKLNLITMFPYNSTIYFRPVLELGVRYSPFKSRYRTAKGS